MTTASHPIEAWMQGVAKEDLEPAGGTSGSAVDVAETIPMPMLQPDSQPPEGYFEPKRFGESDPFVAELLRKKHAGGEEGAEEEPQTDDDMVEPIVTHEEYEKQQSSVHTKKQEKVEEKDELKKEEKQDEETPNQPEKTEGASPEKTEKTELPTEQPITPMAYCNIVDSDEEINKKKGQRTTVKGTFQDTC